MFKKTIYSLAIAALLATQACSTVFNGGSQSLVANSAEGEENIAITVTTPNGSYKSKLPTTIVTSPSSFNETQIAVSDNCYEETTMTVGKSVTPSFWANFLWGLAFPIAMGVDYIDGHMWKMDQQVLVPVNKLDDKRCNKK